MCRAVVQDTSRTCFTTNPPFKHLNLGSIQLLYHRQFQYLHHGRVWTFFLFLLLHVLSHWRFANTTFPCGDGIPDIYVNTEEGGKSFVTIIAVVVPVTVILLLFVALFIFQAKRKKKTYVIKYFNWRWILRKHISYLLMNNHQFKIR